MTTIAYRSGILAADGYTCAGDAILEQSAQKIFRLKDGGLCAGTGRRALTLNYRNWLNGEVAERPSLVSCTERKDDAEVLVVRPNGAVELHTPDGAYELDGEFVAIGSGEVAAIAAMHMGADAVKAIEIASKCDGFTGGVIRSEAVVPQPNDLPIENIDPEPFDWRALRGLRVRGSY